MKKKKLSKFAIGMFIYVGIALVAIMIFAVIFWNFIADYEKSMPKHGVEPVIEDIQNSKWDKYFNNDSDEYEFESVDNVKNYVIEKCKDKEITCVKGKEYTDTNPVFELQADGKGIALVKLKAAGKNRSKFTEWTFDTISYKDYIPTVTYTIDAPSTTKVYVNGVEVSDKYKTGDGEFEYLKQAALYTDNLPAMTEYTIEGLMSEPTVTGVDSQGQEVSATLDYRTFNIGFAPSEKVKEEHYDEVLKVSSVYAKNFINVKEGLLSYIMPDSELREAVRLSDTYFYPVEYMTGYEFLKQDITNFVYYNDNCFGCDVYVEINAKFSGWSITNKVEKTDMNWIFVKKDDKWYLTSTTYN